MRSLLAFFLVSTSLLGQTLSFQQRQRGHVDYPQTYTAGGSGTAAAGSCSTLVDPDNICGNGGLLTSVSGLNVRVWWSGYATYNAAPGVHTMTVPITSTGFSATLTVSLTIYAKTDPIITSVSGSLPGCTTTNTLFYNSLDNCDLAAGFPGRGAFSPAAQGSSYTDPNFGGVIRTITPLSAKRQMCGDSTTSGHSLNGDLQFTCGLDGHVWVTTVATGVDTWDLATLGTTGDSGSGSAPGSAQCSGMFWDSLVNTKFWCNTDDTAAMYSVTLTTAPTGWLKSVPITAWAGPGTAPSIGQGGDGGASKDNMQCFGTVHGTARYISIVDLQTGSTHSADFSGLATNGLTCGNGNVGETAPCQRACTISKGKDIRGNKWIIAVSIDTGGGADTVHLWSYVPGAGAMVDMGWAAAEPNQGNNPRGNGASFGGKHCDSAAAALGNCLFAEHMDTVEIAGRQYLVLPTYSPDQPYIDSITLSDMYVPDDMQTPVEAGGGQYYVMTTNAVGAGATNDLHTGGAKFAPVAIVETDQDPGITTWNTNTMSIGPPVHVTGTRSLQGGNHLAIVNGDTIRFGTAEGLTNLNQSTCVAANVTGTAANPAFDCTGITGNGTYTQYGSFVVDAPPPSTPYQGEILLIDFTNFIATKQAAVTRIAKHRDWSIAGLGGTTGVTFYNGQSHPSMCPHGECFSFESNFGNVDLLGVFGGSTGYTLPVPPTYPGRMFGVGVFGGGVR